MEQKFVQYQHMTYVWGFGVYTKYLMSIESNDTCHEYTKCMTVCTIIARNARQ